MYAMSMASAQSIEELGIDSSHIQIGGYDTDDYKGGMVWYNLTEDMKAWNITVSDFKLDKDSLLDENVETIAQF